MIFKGENNQIVEFKIRGYQFEEYNHDYEANWLDFYLKCSNGKEEINVGILTYQLKNLHSWFKQIVEKGEDVEQKDFSFAYYFEGFEFHLGEAPTLTGQNVFGTNKNENCADLANAQAKEMGTNIEGGVVNTNSILSIYNANLKTLIDVDGNVNNYINQELEAGRVVVVGVHDGDMGGTDKIGTDHYVTIVGRDFINDKLVYKFIEDAVGAPSQAVNFDKNQLSPGDGTNGINGTTSWGNRDLNVTRVQKNKKN